MQIMLLGAEKKKNVIGSSDICNKVQFFHWLYTLGSCCCCCCCWRCPIPCIPGPPVPPCMPPRGLILPPGGPMVTLGGRCCCCCCCCWGFWPPGCMVMAEPCWLGFCCIPEINMARRGGQRLNDYNIYVEFPPPPPRPSMQGHVQIYR